MGVEVGLALVVLLAAALFLRSFTETREVDPGFRRDGVLLAAYDLTGRNIGGPAARDFTRRLLERLRALPGVEAAAIATSVPLDIHGLGMGIVFRRRALAPGMRRPGPGSSATWSPPATFKTMGIPLRAGTDFADLSDVATPPQAIVNDEFVRRFLGDAEPLGRRLESRGRSYAIAGIVRTSLSDSFGEQPAPFIYLAVLPRPVRAPRRDAPAHAGRGGIAPRAAGGADRARS